MRIGDLSIFNKFDIEEKVGYTLFVKKLHISTSFSFGKLAYWKNFETSSKLVLVALAKFHFAFQ